MRILYYGRPDGNSGSRVQGMRLLGHEVELVYMNRPKTLAHRLLLSAEWRLCNGPLTAKDNRDLLNGARRIRPEITWTEMGRLIYSATLRKIQREFQCIMVNSYSDDFLDPMKRSRHYNRSIPIFDHIFTPRESNFPELGRYGARQVHKFWKGYIPDMHFPESITAEEMKLYGTDVVFIGHGEPSRIEPFDRIAQTASFKVWGNAWQKLRLPEPLKSCVQFRGAEGHEYRKALRGAKIGIQYLSTWARDTQASRSFEIPACGVFMLANRTNDHLSCFEEGKEAEFFETTNELVDKIKFYLRHDEARRRIADAGYRRCISSGYSNLERIRQMLEIVTGQPQQFCQEPAGSERLPLPI